MVVITTLCFLSLPVAFVLFFLLAMSAQSIDCDFLRVMMATFWLWVFSLLLGPICGVIFQKLKWRWATWISVATPISLSFAINLLLVLLFAGVG